MVYRFSENSKNHRNVANFSFFCNSYIKLDNKSIVSTSENFNVNFLIGMHEYFKKKIWKLVVAL